MALAYIQPLLLRAGLQRSIVSRQCSGMLISCASNPILGKALNIAWQDLPFPKRMDRWRCCNLLDDQRFWQADTWQGTGSHLCLNSWWTQLTLHARLVKICLRPQYYDPWVPTSLHSCFTMAWCHMLCKDEGNLETSHHWFWGTPLGQSHKSRLCRAVWQGLPNSIHQRDHWGCILYHWSIPIWLLSDH